MKPYTRITIWENRRRLAKLQEFRDLVAKYLVGSRVEWMADGRIESADAKAVRVLINRLMDQAHDIILWAGINPTVRWTPPPVVGGYVQNVDLVQNIFGLHRFQIAGEEVFDFIDRAIGVYEGDRSRALRRTLNPFFYLGLLFDWIAALPFVLIGRMGFSRTKAETSVIGKVTKGFLYLISAVASVLTILHLLDYLEPARQLVQQFGETGRQANSLEVDEHAP